MAIECDHELCLDPALELRWTDDGQLFASVPGGEKRPVASDLVPLLAAFSAPRPLSDGLADFMTRFAGDTNTTDIAEQVYAAVEQFLSWGLLVRTKSEVVEGEAAADRFAEEVRRIRAGRPRATAPLWLDTAELRKDAEGNVVTDNADGSPCYVMVRFEQPMMDKAADILCRRGGHVLNVGHGCGLIDDAIQGRAPLSHTIVEPHPQVLDWMREAGWMDRPNTTVLQSCWEDVDWTQYRHHFDAVYNDVFPFDAEEGGLDLWLEVARMILKPVGGVCVLYGPGWTASRVEEVARRTFGARASVHLEPCEVHVPFEIPEWSRHGVGTHTVPVPWIGLGG